MTLATDQTSPAVIQQNQMQHHHFLLEPHARCTLYAYLFISPHKPSSPWGGDDDLVTPAWHHIPFLHSISHFSSQLFFLVCTPIHADNPDNSHLTVMVALSRPLYLCLADKTTLLNVSTIKTHAASHAHQLGQLTNGRQTSSGRPE
jgi:hypothetical protein